MHSPETDNQYEIVKWLKNQLPLPSIIVYTVENDIAFTLMSRTEGKMLCANDILKQPELVTELAARGIKNMWEIDVSDCPCRFSRLEERLK